MAGKLYVPTKAKTIAHKVIPSDFKTESRNREEPRHWMPDPTTKTAGKQVRHDKQKRKKI
jgi:hypothetical protein